MEAVCKTCHKPAEVRELFHGECTDCKEEAYTTCKECGNYLPLSLVQDNLCPSCHETIQYARWFFEQLERDRYDNRNAS